MLMAMFASVILVAVTIVIHYEALRLTWTVLPRLTFVRPRARIVFVMFAAFAAHTIEIYCYAIAFWLIEAQYGLGNVVQDVNSHEPLSFVDLIYFSSITYTSVGFGDVVPLGGLRLLTGVEALNGLLMIGWTVSFTYLCMQDLWPLHARRHRAGASHKQAGAADKLPNR